MVVADPILTAFSFLFLIWFVLVIVMEIFYCARKRMDNSKKVLYAGLIFSVLAAIALTGYTAYFVQNNSGISYMIASFIGNFILWVSPVVIAALIYWVYTWKNNQKPKEPEDQPREEKPKNMSSSIYGNQIKKD